MREPEAAALAYGLDKVSKVAGCVEGWATLAIVGCFWCSKGRRMRVKLLLVLRGLDKVGKIGAV